MNNRIELQGFFNYIFRDEDSIPKRIQGTKEPEKRKQAVENEIHNFFNSLFATPEEQADFKKRLRPVLRELKAAHLEKVLYGNAEEKLTSKYHMPKDDEIRTLFREVEKKYNYFSESKDGKLEEKFIAFYKLCKVLADTVESYANQDNDSLATLNAYKLLVLFGTEKLPQNYLKPFCHYLKLHNYQTHNMPLHDALQWAIPNNLPQKIDLAAWKTIINTSGIKGFQLLDIAPRIEKELGRPPKNQAEADEIARNITYPRLAEFAGQFKDVNELMTFANLCRSKVSEKNFYRCLEIYAKRKKEDNLPEAKDIELNGYYLVKLPINDLRAFILGHLTDCCQSIGGDSEQCVIDGVTLPNCGFYVMLKSKNKESNVPILNNGAIDYKNFDIVGQGYAWRTVFGNLTFDSWENLRPSNDDIAIELLKKFGEQVTNAHPNITRVTIGLGGRTPKKYRDDEKLTISEKMKEGLQYGDSTQQALVHGNDVSIQRIISELKSIIESKNTDLTPEQRQKLLKHFSQSNHIFMSSQPEILKVLLASPVIKEYFLPSKKGGLNPLQSAANIFHLYEVGIPIETIEKMILNKYNFSGSVISGIVLLFKESLFENNKIRQSVLEHTYFNEALDIASTCSLLKKNALIENESALEIVLKTPFNPDKMANAIIKLNNLGLLDNKEIINKILSQKVEDHERVKLIYLFIDLQQEGILQNKEIYNVLINSTFCLELGTAFQILNSQMLLANLDLQKIVISGGLYFADKMANLLVELKKMDLLDNPKMMSFLLKRSGVEFSPLICAYNELKILGLNSEAELEFIKIIFSDPENASATMKIIQSNYKNGSLHLLKDKEVSQSKLHILNQVAPKLVEANADSKLIELITGSEVLSHFVISNLLSVQQIKALVKSNFEQFTLKSPQNLDEAHPKLLQEFKSSNPNQNFRQFMALVTHGLIDMRDFHSLLDNKELNLFEQKPKETSDALTNPSLLFQKEQTQQDTTLMALSPIRTACIDKVSNLFDDIVTGKQQNAHAFRELKEVCAKFDANFALLAAKEKYCDLLIKENQTKSNSPTFFSSNTFSMSLNKISDEELRNDLLSMLQMRFESPITSLEGKISNPKQ